METKWAYRESDQKKESGKKKKREKESESQKEGKKSKYHHIRMKEGDELQIDFKKKMVCMNG